MPKVSTASSMPNYTLLQAFHGAISENDMAVLTPDTDMGHVALTMKTDYFTKVN